MDLSVCFYCSVPLDDYSKTVDHLISKSRGGILSNKNKVVCCRRCNELKGNKTPIEFLGALDSLIYFEVKRHKESIGYFKRVKSNVLKLNNKNHGDR